MKRPSPHVRSPTTLVLAAIALAACNAIFGVDPGEPLTGTSSTGVGGTGGATSVSGSATSVSGTGSGGGAGATSVSSSSGTAGATCGADAGAATGPPYKLKASYAPEAEAATGAAFGAQGNLVVAGAFSGPSLNLGGGPHAHGPAAGYYDMFVVKYAPDTTHVWSKVFGGTRDLIPHAVAVGPSGEIWVTGKMLGTVQLGAGPPLVAPIESPPNEYPDLFVLKLDATGEVVWAKNFGNGYIQAGLGVAVDSAGNGYVTGVGWDVYDVGLAPIGLPGTWSSYVVKLAPNGNPIWHFPFSSWAPDLSAVYGDYHEMAVAVDKDDHVIVGGGFIGQDFFGGDPVVSYGGADAFILKLASDTGAPIWRTFLHAKIDADAGTDGDQWVTSLTTDACGDVIVAGGFHGAIDFGAIGGATTRFGDPIDSDMWVAKLAGATGEPAWFRTFGDVGAQEALAVRVDASSNVVLAGFLVDGPGYHGVDFGPGIGVLSPPIVPAPDYNPDAFVVKLDASGNGLWGKRLGEYEYQRGNDVAVDADGHVALVGEFVGSLSVGVEQPTVTSDYFDAFFAWFDP